MASLDVTALFTNVSTTMAVQAVDYLIPEGASLCNIEKSGIIEALELCLKSTYFRFNSKTYKQIHGVAMGSPVSATVANLVMEFLEEKTVKKSGTA